MDGKIMQEATGFVGITEPQKIAYNTTVTIQTNFTPKILLANAIINSRYNIGLGLKPDSVVYFPSAGQYITVDDWGDSYIKFSTVNISGLSFLVTVLG